MEEEEALNQQWITPKKQKAVRCGWESSAIKRRRPNELTIEELTPEEIEEYNEWKFIMRGTEVYEVEPEENHDEPQKEAQVEPHVAPQEQESAETRDQRQEEIPEKPQEEIS